MMIDRNIRKNRSKEETAKAHRQAAITIAVIAVIWIVLNRIQKLILKLLAPVSTGLAVVVSRLIVIGLAVFILMVLYRYAKNQKKE